ncbi:unnamed protein product, partial [Meganyctiphanes norvegica]
MSSLIMKLSKVAVIGGSAAIGWIAGYTQNDTSLPTFSTVSAAAHKGSVMMETQEEGNTLEPQKNAPRIAQIMRFGFPGLSNIRSLNDYILSYDTRNRQAYWVFEHLTADNVAKNEAVDRNKSDFHEDLSVHNFFRSKNSDYKGSGFDRGHLAAAGNHRRCQEHCDETFLLSNMSPQVGKGFNRDKWNDLEMYCRKLARQFRNVYVCTGPLFLPRYEEDGKLYVKYQVVGQNHVSVPTHYFKVVVCETENGDLEMESFVLPNKIIDNNTPLNTFHVSAEVVERSSGLLFFDKINRNRLKRINGKSVGWL